MKKRPVDLRLLLSLLGLLALGGVVTLITGCGSGSPKKQSSAKQESLQASGLLSPVAPAPALALHNYLGRPVDIASYKGKVVLVTFLYTHCPDTCPLIAANLRVAQNLMTPAVRSKVAIVAVS